MSALVNSSIDYLAFAYILPRSMIFIYVKRILDSSVSKVTGYGPDHLSGRTLLGQKISFRHCIQTCSGKRKAGKVFSLLN